MPETVPLAAPQLWSWFHWLHLIPEEVSLAALGLPCWFHWLHLIPGKIPPAAPGLRSWFHWPHLFPEEIPQAALGLRSWFHWLHSIPEVVPLASLGLLCWFHPPLPTPEELPLAARGSCVGSTGCTSFLRPFHRPHPGSGAGSTGGTSFLRKFHWLHSWAPELVPSAAPHSSGSSSGRTGLLCWFHWLHLTPETIPLAAPGLWSWFHWLHSFLRNGVQPVKPAPEPGCGPRNFLETIPPATPGHSTGSTPAARITSCITTTFRSYLPQSRQLQEEKNKTCGPEKFLHGHSTIGEVPASCCVPPSTFIDHAAQVRIQQCSDSASSKKLHVGVNATELTV